MDKINHDITEIILQHVTGSTPTTYGDMIKHLEYYTKQSHSLGYAEGLRKAVEVMEKDLTKLFCIAVAPMRRYEIEIYKLKELIIQELETLIKESSHG